MWAWWLVAVIIFLVFIVGLYCLLAANNPRRDVDQEWEEQMKYMHEQYLKHKRKHQITVNGK